MLSTVVLVSEHGDALVSTKVELHGPEANRGAARARAGPQPGRRLGELQQLPSGPGAGQRRRRRDGMHPGATVRWVRPPTLELFAYAAASARR